MPQLEPVVYNASREADRIQGFHDPADGALPKRPIIGDNPLTSFETFHTQVQTDLSKWMTFSQEDRLKKAKAYKEMGGPNESLKIDMDRRFKILMYVIFLEGAHPLGDSYVAAVAFRGIFPNHRPAPLPPKDKEE